MTPHFDRFTGRVLRLLLVVGCIFTSSIPVRSWAFAQSSAAPLWVVRSLITREYGVNDPKGLAFSPTAGTFLLPDGSPNVALLTMDEESAGTRNLPEAQNDPLNVAFDRKSGSLFVFNRGKAELVQIKADGGGLPDGSASPTRFASTAYGVKDPQGITFDSGTGHLFILDAGHAQIVSVTAHATLGFNAAEALRANKVGRISLKRLGAGPFRGLAYNPGNGHLYVSEPAQKKLYELTQSGSLVATFDLAALGISDPSAMTFAPSVDNTDAPEIQDLFILDNGQAAKSDSQIVELSLGPAAALPPGTTLLPASLVHMIDTSNASWNPSAPDPAGVDYWPLTGRLLIADSEVDEMPPYWTGKNVFQSTTSGTLVSTCSTTSFTNEPTGLAINPNNNHIFFSTDLNDRIFEVSLGGDGQYCTTDDTVTSTNVSNLYNITDAEDVAYGNNTLFIAGGLAAEIYRIPLGANGVLGGGDDGAMTHFDTAALGFADMEAIGYNADASTLFIASTRGTDRYLGETTTTGTLLRAYDLSLMGSVANLRSDVSYAPGSQNPALKNIYFVSRGIDNNNNPNENDGKVWEISLGSAQATATPTTAATFTSTPTATAIPTMTPIGMFPAPAGTYDDTHSAWRYSSGWTVYTGSGPANNTLHYTDIVGSYTELLFNGTRFTLTFTRHPNRGLIDVFVDGARITTINANAGSLLWQQSYMSPALTSGNHTVRLVYASAGTYIDIDAIQIYAAAPAGTYDDNDSNWIYSGAWTALSISGPANNTIHYTGSVGDSAELLFNGARFKLTFTKHTNRGLIDVYVDGVKIDTINANSGSLLWQQTYTSPALTSGNHIVRLVYASAGTYIDIDAIQIYAAAPAGTYDDNDSNWIYSGAWTALSISGPANNTLHYTDVVGSYAELLFMGTRFTLTFTKHTNRGLIDVYVDGNKITTINANSGSLLWQQTYTSPVLAAGNHIVRFVYASAGTYIDVDAIEVLP